MHSRLGHIVHGEFNIGSWATFSNTWPNSYRQQRINNQATNEQQSTLRLTQNDLVARKIAELPLGLYGHRNYLSEHGVPQILIDLHAHRFIGFGRETSLMALSE